MQRTRTDPQLVAVSVIVYRWLVGLYPQPFRNDYGPHMRQVFRDQSLATYRQKGPAGLPPMWAYTLFDLMKTAVEEHLQRGTTMTRDAFVRLSGWGMVVGTLLMAVAFSGVADENSIRSLLYDLFGPPIDAGRYTQLQTASSVTALLPGIFGLGLITLGILGLELGYGDRVGQPGKTFLWLSVVSGTLSALASVGLFGSENAWGYLMWTMIAMLFFLGLFGLVAVFKKPLPVGNGLPLVAGLAPAVTLVFFLVLELPDAPLLANAVMLLAATALVLLGYTQASMAVADVNVHDSAAKLPV